MYIYIYICCARSTDRDILTIGQRVLPIFVCSGERATAHARS